MNIDALSRRFADAAADLGDALLARLQQQDATLATKVAQSVRAGERLQLRMEFGTVETSITLVVVDDYERAKRVMTIPGVNPRKH